MKLVDDFRGADVPRVVVFVDIVGSTSMKERESQGSWLTNIASFYDIINEVVTTTGSGRIVKLLGDGAMLVYDDDNATQAINDAIKIQEAIKEDVQKKKVLLHASIGIATGEVAEFTAPNGQLDCLGTVVDRAARLCSVGSAGAIFVDNATTQAALMHRVKSMIGSALDRKTDEYQAPMERVTVPGFTSPLEYHEILWEQQLFGVKSKAMTAAADSSASTVRSIVPQTGTTLPPTEKTRALRGVVRFWDDEKRRGIVASGEGEEFYCDERYTVGEEDLERDDIVYFVPFGVAADGKNRVAGATMYVGQTTKGNVVHVSDKGFGFIQVEDSRGNTQDVFMSREDGPATLNRGDRVSFAIAETGRGARAEEIELDSGDAKIAA